MAKGDIITVGLSELLESNVKELVVRMEWMKTREMRLITSIEELSRFVDRAVQVTGQVTGTTDSPSRYDFQADSSLDNSTVIEKVPSQGICALDLETTSLNTRKEAKTKIVGFSLCFNPIFGVYVPINHLEEPENNLPQEEVLREIRRLCAGCTLIFHNAKYDCAMLENYGIDITDQTKFEDTLLMAHLYDASAKNINLKDQSKLLLKQTMLELTDICGKENHRYDMVSPKIGYVYAVSDAICTFDLYNFFKDTENLKKQSVIYNIEKMLSVVVRKMEAHYVKIDIPYLLKIQKEAERMIEDIKKEVCKIAGKEFNVSSTQQLGKVLFDELGYEYPLKTRTASGQYSTDMGTLQKIAKKYPLVGKIIHLRGMEKTLGTYIGNLIANADENGCVKMAFNQSGTDTGRFSSPGGQGLHEDGYSSVNVQSIPATYDENAIDIRRAFVARPGYKIVALDYSGEELRVATNISGEEKWIDEFLNGTGDLHSKTAKLCFNKEVVTPLERSTGKTCNFLIVYGGGARGLAEQAGLSEMEARRILSNFFLNLPRLKRWIDVEKLKARKIKFAMTPFGRIRPLAMYYDSGDMGMQAHGDRCATNFQIQGSCADIMKIVMVRIFKYIQANNLQDEIRMLLTMHDELVFEIKEDKLDVHIPKLAEIMALKDLLTDKLHWPVPLTVDAEYGDSWHVDHDYYKERGGQKVPETPKPMDAVSSESLPQPEAVVIITPELKPVEAPEAPKTEEILPVESSSTLKFQLDSTVLPPVSSPNVINGDFVYTINETSDRVVRILNMILDYLDTEEGKSRAYTGKKAKLCIRDKDNNSFLVNDIYVYPDAFLALARFFNL